MARTHCLPSWSGTVPPLLYYYYSQCDTRQLLWMKTTSHKSTTTKIQYIIRQCFESLEKSEGSPDNNNNRRKDVYIFWIFFNFFSWSGGWSYWWVDWRNTYRQFIWYLMDSDISSSLSQRICWYLKRWQDDLWQIWANSKFTFEVP